MIERTFLGWDEPALPAAARRLADAHADGSAPSLDRALVVLPGRRAGRRLRELLLEEGDRRAGPVPPPRTVTPGVLPELLYEPARPRAGSLLARRAWARALRSVPTGVLETVFPEPPEEDDLTAWDGLGRVMAGLREDVAAEGHDFGAVAGLCASDPELEDGDRWQALARVEKAYLEGLADLGVADRHEARRRALDEGRLAADGPVWLVGVVELPGVTREMLRRLDAPVRPLIHAPADLAGGFDELGAVRPDPWVERELVLPELTVCGRPPEQADAALSALAGDGRPLAPDEVTVGVPNDEVAPHLAERLGELGVPHRDAAGTPLPETAPYRLLEATAAYLDGRRFADLAALVRHPDVGRRLDVPLEEVDEYFEEHLPQRTDALPLAASRVEEQMTRLLGDLRSALGLDELRGRRPLTEWMGPALGVLEGVYGDREVDRSRPSGRRLSEACSRIADEASTVAELPEGAAPECTAATAVRLLLSELRGAAIPPEPVRPAVEMLGWLELHLDDAPALVLTGLDDGSVPGTAAGDPFLPDRLRSRLGLSDDRSRHGRDAYLLEASLRPREESHLVVGRRTAGGDPLRPSRLLLAASGRELAERVERLFGEEAEEAVAAVRPRGERADGDDRRERFPSPPEPVIRVEEPPARLYVTDFRDLLEDPYRFALERLRGLESRGDRDRELGPPAFGGLAHRVLHRFADSDAAHSTDPDEIRGRLRELVEDEARRRFGADAYPAVRLQVRHLRVRLRAFARWQARRAREGWRIAAAEVKPEGEGVEFEVDGEPVLLRGRIDRIDRHEERDEWQVLDYKTGESPSSPDDRHRKGRRGEKRWVDLQLPLYRHLLPGVARRTGLPDSLGRARERLELGYLHLSSEGVELLLADWTREQLDAADEAARRAVRTLREGVFRFRPGERRTFRDDPLDVLFPEAGRAGETAPGEGPADGDGEDDA
ncbi:MAG: PD-(D/E)XK nuclease family protein [Candidatus Palauibacterales bacterium]|nr:PD-(D/E)XK nuclease family protein [Candidatus Palauibacterales bacterium]